MADLQIFFDQKPPKDKDEGSDPPPRKMNQVPKNGQLVRIQSNQINDSLDFLLGPEPLAISDGIGGWVEIERPNDVSISDWPGVAGFKVEVQVVVDHWTDNPLTETKDSVKNSWQKLMRVGRDIKGDTSEPPPLRLYGRVFPDFLNGELFVIQGVEPGETLFSESDQPRRQFWKIRFLEYSKGDTVKLKKRKARGRDDGKGGGDRKKKYTVKKGDTLQSIARDLYGDQSKWKKIAEANNLRNGRNLTPGDKLKIP